MTSLPNVSHVPTRLAFHQALLGFCKSYNSSSCPLIIVHSDAGSGGKAEASWMDRDSGGSESVLDVVGRDVFDGPWSAEIKYVPFDRRVTDRSFRPLAPTFITKALNRVLTMAIQDPALRPPSGAIQLIAQSNGDLRSAINSLQMLSSGKSLKATAKKRKTDAPRTKATGRGSRGGKGAKVDLSDEIRSA